MINRLPALLSAIAIIFGQYASGTNSTSNDSAHRVEQSALVAAGKNASDVLLTLECTPLDKPVVTFDQTVKSSVVVAGNEIKFIPALNDGVGITASYTCP